MTEAQKLRRAAALMRERAGAATPGRWEAGERCVWSETPLDPYVVHDGEAGDGGAFSPGNAAHIASWHPDVALAVAALLEDEAGRVESVESLLGCPVRSESPAAVAVARAYLGESQSAAP